MIVGNGLIGKLTMLRLMEKVQNDLTLFKQTVKQTHDLG